MNLNKVIIVGNLTRDPETRTTPSGQSVSNFGVATNRFYNDAQGQKQKQTEFHNVVAWGKLAEIAKQYLTKGKSVMVEGRLQTRSWQGPDNIKKFRTEIIAEKMQLGPKTQSTGEAAPLEAGREDIPVIEIETSMNEEIKVEDIPF